MGNLGQVGNTGVTDSQDELVHAFLNNLAREFRLQDILCDVSSTYTNRFVLSVSSKYPNSSSSTIELQSSVVRDDDGSLLVLDIRVEGDYRSLAGEFIKRTEKHIREEYSDIVAFVLKIQPPVATQRCTRIRSSLS